MDGLRPQFLTPILPIRTTTVPVDICRFVRGELRGARQCGYCLQQSGCKVQHRNSCGIIQMERGAPVTQSKAVSPCNAGRGKCLTTARSINACARPYTDWYQRHSRIKIGLAPGRRYPHRPSRRTCHVTNIQEKGNISTNIERKSNLIIKHYLSSEKEHPWNPFLAT